MSALWQRRCRALHRGLAAVVGVQLLFWVLGGLTMASLNLERVRGADRRAQQPQTSLNWEHILSPEIALKRAGVTEPVQSLHLEMHLNQPLYLAKTNQQRWLIHAENAQLWSPLSEERAVAVALADYSSSATVEKVEWVETAGTEYRGRELPLWKVQLTDARRTALYVDPFRAEVVARRNRYWRIFDWMWMLHIMDYRQRDDFNHPLLVVFAGTTLAFVVSGASLLFFAWRRGRNKPA